MDQQKYEECFGGTPMTRAKRNGLRRNALIALTVTDHPNLDKILMQAENDNASPIRETLDQIRLFRSRSEGTSHENSTS